jgi:phosphopantetheinyl transferase
LPLQKEIILDDLVKVGVWHITETEPELRSLLSRAMKDPADPDAFKNESRRKQWMAARILLSALLEKKISIGYHENGKPWLKDGSWQISVSHSGDMAAAAISSRFHVGIDIERIRDRVARVAGRFLSEAELPSPALENRIEKLHVSWGAKEALYKLNGNPGVDLRRDIFIHSFDYLCKSVQTCQASMIINNISRVYPVYYEKIDEYMLAFTYDNNSPMTNDQ